MSKRKFSANHRLSTDHSLRSTTSWAMHLSPRWTSNTSILQGRKDYWTGKPASWDILSRSCHFHYPIFLYIWEPYSAGSSHGLTLYIFSLSFRLSDKKFVFYFWLKGGNQLGVISEDLKNFLLFLLFGFSIVFFSCWFDFCQISWLYYEKTFIKAWIFWEAVLTFGAQS